jgi:hypothetical protein
MPATRARGLLVTLLAAVAGLLALAQEPGAGEFTVIQGEAFHRPGSGAVTVTQTGATLREGVTLLPTGDFGSIGTNASRSGSTLTLTYPGRPAVNLEAGSDQVRDTTGAVLATLAAPVQVEAGEVLVPVRATEALGYCVDFDSFTREVTFRAPGGRVYGLTPTGLLRDNLAGTFRAPRVGEKVRTGDVVRTGEGRVEISAGGSIIRLDRHSEVTITAVPAGPDEGRLGFLASIGRTWSRIFGARPYELRTPAAVAAAQGTAWLTEVSYDDETLEVTTQFQVHEGAIEVRYADGARDAIASGEEVEVRREPLRPGALIAAVRAARRLYEIEAARRLEFVRESIASDTRFRQFFEQVRRAGLRTVPLTVSIRLPPGVQPAQPPPAIPLPGFPRPVPVPRDPLEGMELRVTVWAFDRLALSVEVPPTIRALAGLRAVVAVPVGLPLELRVDATFPGADRAFSGRADLGAVSAARAVPIQLVPVAARVDGLIVVDRLDDRPTPLILAVGSTTGIVDPVATGYLVTTQGPVRPIWATTADLGDLDHRFIVGWSAEPDLVQGAELIVTDADGFDFRPRTGMPRRAPPPARIDPGRPDVRRVGDRVTVRTGALTGALRILVYTAPDGSTLERRMLPGPGPQSLDLPYLGPGRIELFALVPAGGQALGYGVSRSTRVD